MRALSFLRSAPLRIFGLGVGLVLAIGLVLTYTAMEVSSQPAFCGSCHVMTPYFESWKSSAHHNVACVDCHIAPGITAEFQKKYEAVSMVARYFTGTYGTNPWTEIEDAACLECHERRLLSGKELFGDVLFDHTVHLAGMRRGKKLRCTSCHSQIVQGSHISVTTSTCILCHFKGQPSGAGTARCTLCHIAPETVVTEGTLSFDHADVGRFGMECTWCHARPVGSDGNVPRERCVTCHNDPKRLEEYGDVDLLHQKHVTDHKVDCMDCHLELDHVAPARIEAAGASCESCHERGHSPQTNLYAGLGGKGVEPMPDPMFTAGVRCTGCHLPIPGHDSDVHRASEISCMSCHGPSYRKIFLTWREGISRLTGAVERQVSRTESELGRKAPAVLADARHNLDLVRKGRGIHNVAYSNALLRRSHTDMNSARRGRGLAELPQPWVDAPSESPCLGCHQGIETQRGRIFGRMFDHAPHLGRARLECASCHRPHEGREKKEVVHFGSGGCDACHHGKQGRECSTCHADVRSAAVESFLGAFDHELHLDAAGLGCTDCHEQSAVGKVELNQETCAACHE